MNYETSAGLTHQNNRYHVGQDVTIRVCSTWCPSGRFVLAEIVDLFYNDSENFGMRHPEGYVYLVRIADKIPDHAKRYKELHESKIETWKQ